MAKFNNVELTQETILATRKHFAANCQACIDAVINGEIKLASHVLLEDYFTCRREDMREYLAGHYDHTFTFLQRAYYIRTGDCVALLPK